MQKLPILGLSTLFLAVIVAAVSGVERRSLLAPARSWVGGWPSMTLAVIAVSSLLKLWTAGSGSAAMVGSIAVFAVGRMVLSAPAREEVGR